MMKLTPLAYTPFTTNELKPSGWLRQQLEIQARSLSGNLDKIWPEVRDSRWLGGEQDGWERFPYWLDGFIPMAYLLEDPELIERAKKYVDAMLNMQQEDGWICPCTEEERERYDVWATYLVCKVLVLYYDCSKDPRIEDAVYRALYNLYRHIGPNTIFNWAAARWFECLIPLFWLYERRPEEWMLDLAHTLRIEGFNFEELYNNWRFQVPERRWTLPTHVVNIAMSLKAQGLYSRLTGEDPNRLARKAWDLLQEYHGTATGHFTGDECLSGNSPIQGAECCSIVESMYSYENLLSISGSPEWGDRVEALAFNSLPATLSPDMWTHQYDQQINQVCCTRLPAGHIVFRSNPADSHIFGLQPCCGCCTANFNQGWPKLALSTFMRSPDGIASTVLAPSVLSCQVQGVPVRCQLKTEYPFRETLTYTMETEAPVTFAFSIRIPSTVVKATVNGEPAQPGTFFRMEKEWNGKEEIQVAFTFETRMEKRPNDMYCVKRGPLLYSVAIEEEWTRLEYEKDGVVHKFPYCDYDVRPLSKWNYAFASDAFEVTENPNYTSAFSTENPPISMTGKFYEINWGFDYGVCHEVPDERIPLTPAQTVRLIPYGCTNLRMTEMPWIQE